MSSPRVNGADFRAFPPTSSAALLAASRAPTVGWRSWPNGGPRVVRFGLCGGRNIFAETPTASWEGGHGTYELLGGHQILVRARDVTIAACPTRPA